MAIQSIGRSAIGAFELLTEDSERSNRAEAARDGFSKAMGTAIAEANRDQMEASRAISDLLVEGRGTIHDAMIAVNNAEGSFRLLMELRNRLIEGVNSLLETRI